MPVLTITAVVNATDRLTIPAHGQVTGAGPAAIRTPDGALPAPLAAVTDYWLIVIDANTVKLATSSANAMAGTAIDLTTDGSGTLLLELGIPYRRARTYVPKAVSVPGSQLKSADLNSKMDALTALHALLTGQAQNVWTVEAVLHVPGRMASEIYGAGPLHAPVNQGFLLAASGQTLSYPIPLIEGCVITGWKLYARKTTSAADTISAQLYKFNDTDGTQTALGALQSNNANAPGFITLGQTGLTEAVVAGVQHYVKFNPGGATAANHIVMGLEVAYKRGL